MERFIWKLSSVSNNSFATLKALLRIFSTLEVRSSSGDCSGPAERSGSFRWLKSSCLQLEFICSTSFSCNSFMRDPLREDAAPLTSEAGAAPIESNAFEAKVAIVLVCPELWLGSCCSVGRSSRCILIMGWAGRLAVVAGQLSDREWVVAVALSSEDLRSDSCRRTIEHSFLAILDITFASKSVPINSQSGDEATTASWRRMCSACSVCSWSKCCVMAAARQVALLTSSSWCSDRRRSPETGGVGAEVLWGGRGFSGSRLGFGWIGGGLLDIWVYRAVVLVANNLSIISSAVCAANLFNF